MNVQRLATNCTIGGCLAVALLVAIAGTPVAAQSEPEATTPPPDAAARLNPIPDVDISARSALARELERGAESKITPDERLTQIEQALPVEQQRIAALVGQTDELLETAGSTSLIREAEKASVRSRDRLDGWMRDLSARTNARASTLEELQEERSVWELTRDVEREAPLPEALENEITEVIDLLRAGETRARTARDSVLALQASIARQQSVLEEILTRQREEITRRTTAIFEVDSSPLWKALRAPAQRGGVVDQVRTLVQRQWQDLRGYVAEEGARLSVWLVLWVALAALLISLRHRSKAWVQKDPSLDRAVSLFDRPIAAAAVLILALTNIVDTQAPAAWLDVLNLVLVLALLFLLLGVLDKSLHPMLYLLIPLYFFFQLVNLAPVASLAHRLAILALGLVGVVYCVWFLRVLRAAPDRLPPAWQRALERGMRLAILLYAAGMIANVLGSVRLGALAVVGTTDAVFTGIILWVVSALLRSIVRVTLVTKSAHRLGIAPEHTDAVRDQLFRLISLVAVIVFGVFALRGFTLYEPVADKVRSILGAELSIGEFSLSLGAVLTFVLIIWLSAKLAALMEFVLGELLLPRMRLPQGAAHAVSRVGRYTVIFIGLLVAIKALGFDISQAAIVAGGLGVGIGFGLQNVVSNFVSGLILLFERPIRVGDIIEVGTTSGQVTKIGMRATLVRTWPGSELVVPNSQLIASNVVNWTLQNDRRRLEIPVGVAYGTDPEVVAKLLVDIAARHPRVDAFPEPQCLFLGFGESSLDFQLRAWAEAGEYFGIESELRFTITRALDEAGITIPFPQRDLHLHPAGGQLPAVTPTGMDPSDS